MKNYFAISAFTALLVATALLGISNLETSGPEPVDEASVQKFESDQAFRQFLSGSSGGRESFEERTRDFSTDFDSSLDGSSGSSGSEVERSSDTNIQVSGVNEPDILKNGGEKIFYSSEYTDY
ncbi:MAG: hypothetical protein BRC30_02720, partial [Nanohaloarchaea archaeon SW_7_46_7]